MFDRPRAWLHLSCLIVWVTCNASAAAPSPKVEGYSGIEPRFESVGAGVIPRDVVPTFVQDQAGYFWIATGDGLVRFDGYQFRPQERQNAEPTLRNMGWIRAMLAGNDGKVWIGTESHGLASYDPVADRVFDYGGKSTRQMPDAKALNTAPLPTIRALAEDADGQIYIGSVGGGLEVFNPKTAQFTSHLHTDAPGALPDNRIQALLIDRQQNLWIGSWAGLTRKAKGSQQFETFRNTRFQGHVVQAILEASDGRIWVGAQDGVLSVLDPKTGVVKIPAKGAAGLDKGPITSFVETPDHSIWVGRSGGIQIYDTSSELLLNELHHDVHRPGSLAADEVTHLMMDKAGWIWVSGFGLGLQRHNPANKSIFLREADLAGASPLNNADVRSLLQLNNGEVWAATHVGDVAILDSGLLALGKLAQTPGAIESMVQMADETIWLGSNSRLQHYDQQRRLINTVAHHGGQTRRLFESVDGTLWVATQDGVYRMEPSSGTLVRLQSANGTPEGEVHAFAQAPDHSVWIGTSAGLYRVPAASRDIQPVHELTGEGLSSGIVIGLLFDRRGTLWVDTGVGGVTSRFI